MKKIYLFVVLLLSFSTLFAQQNNIWYFGDEAGLDFNGGAPVTLTDGAMTSDEGCASIADDAGNLLFYTNGEEVWNKNHNTMSNGTGLSGDPNSSQSSIIVQKPNSTTIYYVFTVGLGGVGLKYSEVDMSLNGGLGGVNANKNINIVASTAEKVTAVLHQDGESYWIVTHLRGNNTFHSYLLSSTGLNMTPVATDIGSVISGNFFGYLRASLDGSRMAATVYGAGEVEVFDFNNATGVLSNPITINHGVQPYGLEFSSNNAVLYTSSGFAGLHQYDLLAGSEADINASEVNLGIGTSALLRGPDDKIYVVGPSITFLDVIDKPNILGTGCDYLTGAVSLSGRQALASLPNFPNSIIQSQPAIPLFSATITPICGQLPSVELINLSTGASVFSWDFGDGNTSNLETPPPFQYAAAGTYTISLLADNVSTSTLITVENRPFPEPEFSITLSEECGNFPLVELINLTTGTSTYLWNFGDGTTSTTKNPPPFRYLTSGTYTISLEADDGMCKKTKTKTTNIEFLEEIQALFSATLIAECGEAPLIELINHTSGTSVFSWDFGDGNTSNLETPPPFKYALDGTYTISLTAGSGICASTSSTIVISSSSPLNATPVLSTVLSLNTATQCYETEVAVGETLYFELNANDADNDTLQIVGEGVGFAMNSVGMLLNSPQTLPIMSASFSWSPTCDLLPVGTGSVIYELKFQAQDNQECENPDATSDEICVKILLKLPQNTVPSVSSSLLHDAVSDTYYDSLEINNHFNFTFNAQDVDGDSLSVEILSKNGFTMSVLSATFTPTSGMNGSLTAQFDWDILCEHLIPVTSANRTEYFFDVIVKDYDFCGYNRHTDTTQIKLILLPNPNTIPLTSSSLVFDNPNQVYLDTVIVGEISDFTFQIDDLDGDSLTFITQGQGFDTNLEGMIFSPTSGTTTLVSNFTWQTDCNNLDNGAEKHYLFDAIVSDYDLCGNVRSLTTASFDILVLPPVAGSGTITSSSLNYDLVNQTYFDTLQVEDLANFTFDASNSSGDAITLALEGEGFTLTSIGATFTQNINPDNSINGTFAWQTNCNTLQSNDTTDYIFNAIVQDFDICGGQNSSNTTQIRLTVLPIINPAPTVDSAGVSDLIYDAISGVYKVEINFGDTLEFDIMGDDSDGDIVTLIGQPVGFDFSTLEMEFQSAHDLPRVESHFKWITGCNIKDKVSYTQPYLIDFIVSDEGNCTANAADTMRVEITLKGDPNDAPLLTTTLNLNTTSNCYETRVVVGDTLLFDVLATDLNQDELTLTGQGVGFNLADLGMQFSNITGTPASLPLSSEFGWATNFDILEDYQDSIIYELQFNVDDGNCETAEICVKITLVNCQTPDLTGIPAISDLCVAGDTLGREIPANEDWNYWWTSDVGIDGDSTQRLIYVQKAGIYTIHVQHLADHCIYESRTIVRLDELFLAAQDTVICESQAPVNLVARDLAHPSNFIFEWRNLLDTSVIVQTDTTGLLTVDSSGIYLVKMINPDGGCFITDTVQATINPNPSFDIVGYENPVCQDPVGLRVENTNLTGFKVQWSVQAVDSTGYFEGSTNELNVTVLKSGLYIATLTDTATNCETTQSIEIIINDNPMINLNPSLKDTVICQNQDFVVDAFDASYPIDSEYQWRNLSSNETVSDSSKLVIEFGNFDKTVYEITVRTGSSSCESKDTVSVTFVRQAVAKITANQTGICLGDSIILQASGGDFHLWSNGDTTENTTVSPQTVGTYTYILEVQYENSCASSFDTIQIEVSPIPILDIPNYVGACQEDTTAFLDARHSLHAFNSTYKWYWIGDTTSLSDSSRIDLKFDNFQNKGFDVLSPFDLIVEVSNGQNACFATDTVKIEFSKSSRAKIDTVFKKEICLGETITLQGSGGDSLYWNTGDSTNSIRITPEKVGFERIILFANNFNSCSETSDTVFVKVNPLPVIELHELDSITICYGDTLELTPSGVDSGNYVWQHLPSPADTIFVSPEITTTYYVFGTDSNGCQSSDSLKVIVRPTLELPSYIQACEGETLEIGAESPVEAEYFWLNSGFTTPTIKVRSNGTYSVRITTAECVYTRSVEVKFVEYPKLESTSDTTLCFELGTEDDFADGKTHFINTSITNPDTAANYDYVWLDTAGFVLGTADSLEIAEEGNYIVQVFDKNLENTCPVSDTVRIEVACEPRIFIPTGFSPNGDNLNDKFVIFGKHIKNFKMEVHDRWGALIYVLERESLEDIQEDEFWDGSLKGKPLPNGMYLWSIQYQNPFNLKSEIVNFNGKIDIVR